MKLHIFSYKNIAWVALIFLVFFSYYPSLYHMPRGDQVTYLINNLDNHTFKDILANSYSYTRSRQIDGGDYKLFRPVLHSILALHKYFFESNFFVTQLCGVLLHILVIFLLWLISLRLIHIISYKEEITSSGLRPPRNDDLCHCERSEAISFEQIPRLRLGMTWIKLLIFSLIAFIALNPVLIEQVIWTHIQGYLLFVLLMLSSFYFLLKINDNPKKYILLIWSMLFIASFTYELGLVITFLFGAYLFLSSRKTDLKFSIAILFFFLLIPVIYHIINWFDLNRHLEGPLQYYNWREIFLTGSIFKTISNALVLLGYTTLHPLIPSLARYSFGSRLVIGDLRGDGFNFFTVLSIILIAVIFLSTIFKAKLIIKSSIKNLFPFLFLVFVTYVSYLCIIIFGRLNSNIHPSLLTSSSYYSYIGFILFFILITPFIIFVFAKIKREAALLLVIIIWMLNINGSYGLFRLNSDIKMVQSNLYSIVADTREFLKQKSFNTKIYFDLEKSDPIYSFHGVPFTTLIFRRYEDNKNPDYIATIRDNRVSFYKNRDYEIGPRIVKVWPVFNTYFYRGEYYALHHLEGFFSPSNQEYKTLFKAKSLEEINNKVLEHTHLKYDYLSLQGHEPIYLYDKNYKGYQIVRAFGLYYAIPFDAGPLDLFKIDKNISRKHYSSFFLKKNISELKTVINSIGS